MYLGGKSEKELITRRRVMSYASLIIALIFAIMVLPDTVDSENWHKSKHSKPKEVDSGSPFDSKHSKPKELDSGSLFDSEHSKPKDLEKKEKPDKRDTSKQEHISPVQKRRGAAVSDFAGKSQEKQLLKTKDNGPSKTTFKRSGGKIAGLATDTDKTIRRQARQDPASSVARYKGILESAKKNGNVREEKKALINLGNLYYLTGQSRRAAEHYQDALSINRKLRDRKGAAAALRNLAAAYTSWGNYDKAEEYNRESLATFAETGDVQGQRTVLNNLGLLEKNRGRYSKALEQFHKALEIDVAQDSLRILTLNNLGDLSRNWGDYPKALEYYQASLEVSEKMGDAEEEGKALINIGKVYEDLERYDEAVESSKKALGVFSTIGTATNWPKKILGDLYLDMGKVDQAEAYVKEAGYDSSLGRFYLFKSQPETAKRYYERLMLAGKVQGNVDDLFTAYTGLGKAFEALKEYKQAENYYSKGMDMTEEIRSTLLPSERRNFFGVRIEGFSRSEPAKGLVRVLLKQNKAEQSIYPGEVTRARSFADNLSQKVRGTNSSIPEEVLTRETELENKLASLKTARNMLPKTVDYERFQDLSAEIKPLELERSALVKMAWTNYPDYASAKFLRPVTLDTAAIKPDQYVVVLDLLGEGVGVRVIKGRQIIEGYFVQLNVTDLEQDVAKFRKPFEQVRLRDFSPELAQSLYQKLLQKPLKRIPVGKTVTIIPDGFLALLPFEALVVSGTAQWAQGRWGPYPQGLTYVGDLYHIAYYQSLTTMTLVRTFEKNNKVGGRLLVIADPVFEMVDARVQGAAPETRVARQEEDSYSRLMTAIEESGSGFNLHRLSETGELARKLANLYGARSDVYTGLRASKEIFFKKIAPELDRYNAVVFATHGFAGNNIPGFMEPVLALAMVPPGTNGILTMSEVSRLKMTADIVALTACQTGIGMKLAGEGVMSMGRAFQLSGARSVIMSLWSVSEKSSIMMMEEFFKSRNEGNEKAKALSWARKAVRKAGFEHPFFWSAFVLAGEAE